MEVINKVNPSKIKSFDMDVFDKFYNSKQPSNEWIVSQQDFLSTLSDLEYSFLELFVLGGHVYLNKYIHDGFKVDRIPDNLNIYTKSFLLYEKTDIMNITAPIQLETYFLVFYIIMKDILKKSPKSEINFSCYITYDTQIDLYTDEHYNLGKFYFAELNILKLVSDQSTKTLMSISINSNCLYYYDMIILPHFLDVKCLYENITREFIDLNSNIVRKNYISTTSQI